MDIQNVSKIGINYIFRQRKYLGTSIRIRHVRFNVRKVWWCWQLRLAFCQHLEIHRSQNCWKVTELALILKKMFQSIMKIQGVGKWRDSLSVSDWMGSVWCKFAIGWSSQQGCHWSKQKRQFVGAFYWFNPQEGFLYIRKTSRDIQKSLFFRHLIKSFNVLKPSVEIRKRFEYLLRRSKIWGISSFSQFYSGFTEFRDLFHIFSWNVKIHLCIFTV